jgi:hypothetical protein
MGEITQFYRRAALRLVAGTATLAATLSTDALAAGSDPIFEAIARHKEAVRVWNEIDGDLDEAADAAAEVEDEALFDFLSTVPLTMAGIRAGVEYAMKDAQGDRVDLFAVTLLQSPVLGVWAASPLEPRTALSRCRTKCAKNLRLA